MHHDPRLRPSVRARHGSDARDILSGVHVAPFHERTPIHTIPQDAVLPQNQDDARRFGEWECGSGDTSAATCAQSCWPTEPILLRNWPCILLLASTSPMSLPRRHRMHTLTRTYTNMSVSLPRPALLVWLAREFHPAGEAFSSPMTCFDTPFPKHSHFTHMPMFLGGVSIHPRHQTRHPIPFEDQFTDPTSFPHSVLVSLEFHRPPPSRPPVSSINATKPRPQGTRSSW